MSITKFIRKIVSRIKFADQTHLVKFVSDLFYQHWKQYLEGSDIITFVPMHRKRLNQRYFNQSALIAKRLAKISKREVVFDVLRRRKHSKPQVKLSRVERQRNIKGVFTTSERGRCHNKKVVLIDDVYTTGSTVNECAKVLRRSGAKEIVVLTFAKALIN